MMLIKSKSKIKKKLSFIAVPTRNLRHSVGFITWSTKSYELWLILQNLLYLIRPKALVEFGADKSTYYFAEYASKTGSKILSFEQHLYYCLKINFGLRLSFLPSGIVKYAPLKNGWYDTRKLKKHLFGFNNIDFLFVDGPTMLSKGQRNSSYFYDIFNIYLANINFIIIDDVQRKECAKMAGFLSTKYNLKRYEIKYDNDNILAFLFKPEAVGKMSELPVYLRKLMVQNA